jgi:hypothetical protein
LSIFLPYHFLWSIPMLRQLFIPKYFMLFYIFWKSDFLCYTMLEVCFALLTGMYIYETNYTPNFDAHFLWNH